MDFLVEALLFMLLMLGMGSLIMAGIEAVRDWARRRNRS